MTFTKSLEEAIVRLVNADEEEDIYLEDYQKVDIDIYSENTLNDILKKCKFKGIGNIFDYPDKLPQPEAINGHDLTSDFSLFQRIAVSKKFNAVMFYTIERYSIMCYFMMDREGLEKFSKTVKEIMQQGSHIDMFQGINPKCKPGQYIEVSEPTGELMKPADVVKKKVEKESLVFVEDSTIVEVMDDIRNFFKEETQKLYKKLDIAYKRGVIIFGKPGNGKSAMIREIIRSCPDIIKIVINPNVERITKILSSLIKSLDGRQAIIIIEDIDSLITQRNRSEFLNILDGVDVKSGVFIIGSTNYPEQIDPAFMNRSGRFDMMYEIKDPSDAVRRAFFKSRDIVDLLSEYKVFKDADKPDNNEGALELFVKHSEGLAMASLKEIMTSTQYRLVTDPEMSIEEALELTSNTINSNKEEHGEAHEGFRSMDDEDDGFSLKKAMNRAKYARHAKR